MKPINFVQSWGKILRGKIPLLSIEITRECPLTCPGCYAYGDSHLAGGAKLIAEKIDGGAMADKIGDTFVEGAGAFDVQRLMKQLVKNNFAEHDFVIAQ